MPIGWDELKVIYALAKKGIKVNCTCIFTEEQCVLAASSGASYVSIFHCRLKDIGGDPVRVIENTRQIFDMQGHAAEIIVGSIRMQSDILEAHLAGGHIVTAGAKIVEEHGEPSGYRQVCAGIPEGLRGVDLKSGSPVHVAS